MSNQYRIEIDSLGEVEVFNDCLYGAQTARALEHFNIGNDLMPIELIKVLGIVKKAAAIVNFELGKLDQTRKDLIVTVCDEIIEGKLNSQFPLHVWQSGSGTQTNMNLNEVIANRAIQLTGDKLGSKNPIHPNDHVNMSQSSNDVFPAAMHIVSVIQIKNLLLPALTRLRNAFDDKVKEFHGIVKIGRTHLQDAIPLMLSQEFSGYVSLIDRNIQRIHLSLDNLFELALGGSAVGTGLNTPPKFAEKVAAKIAELTELPFRTHPNKFASLSSHDEIVFSSSALRVTACALMKIANDIRWLASGPRCGLGELCLPANEPGSSIMPGKINPTQCEVVTMVATQIMGNDVTIGIAGSQGNFELNVYKPVIIFNFLNSVLLLANAANSFAKFCIVGLEANKKRITHYVENSLMMITALNSVIGYDKAANIAKTAYIKDINLREACLLLGYLSQDEFDELVKPEKMI